MRRFYWSVRRELWEHRAVWMAPLIAAGFALFGFVTVMAGMARRRWVPDLPYSIAITMMLAAMFVVWVFYCLDALHAERRERSILFWKSMPVSDSMTVLSKAAIPLIVLPLVTFVLTATLQLALLLAHKATSLMVGLPAYAPGPFPLLRTWGILLYGLVAMTLWLAPVYAWFLLVSGWVRQAALVWAIVPFVVLTTLERVTFGSTYLSNLFTYRWAGWSTEAFVSKPHPYLLIDPMNSIAPVKFLSSPSLWIGLAVAGLLLAAASRLRRWRSPD